MQQLIVRTRKSTNAKFNKQLHMRQMVGATKRAARSAKKHMTVVNMVPNYVAANADIRLEEIFFGVVILAFKIGDPLIKDAMHAVK